MAQVFVNQTPCALDGAPQTWGDLLANIDESIAGHGLMVMSAVFDGVEEPSFREPAVTARRLHEVERIDVETGTAGSFLRSCLLETLPPLEQAANMALDLSARYRGHDVSACHPDLTTLATELRGLTSLVAMLGGPLQSDLGTSAVDAETVARQLDQFAESLDNLVTAQASEDWLTVADVLEYDIEPAIRQWIGMIRGITETLQAMTVA